MSAITKVFIGALATFATVQALPQQQYTASGFSTAVVASVTPSSTPSATTPAAPAQTSDKNALYREIIGLSTQVQRFQKILTDGAGALLTGDALRKMIVFDFNNAKPAKDAKGGRALGATVENFPAIAAAEEDIQLSVTVAFLNACGINTPHVHPRANEFLTVVDGTVDFGYILENGLVTTGGAEVNGTLNKFEATLFPKGSVHYQFNPTCKPATFVAALDNKDPGTNQIAQAFFGLNPGVVNATLGFPKSIDGKDVAKFKGYIPANLAQDVENCLKKCPNL